jgi:hypothetical protein
MTPAADGSGSFLGCLPIGLRKGVSIAFFLIKKIENLVLQRVGLIGYGLTSLYTIREQFG